MRLILKKSGSWRYIFIWEKFRLDAGLWVFFTGLGLFVLDPKSSSFALGSKKWARSISTRACDVNDRSPLWSSASAQKILPLNFNWASLGRKKHSDKKLTLLSNYCWRLCLRGLFFGGGQLSFRSKLVLNLPANVWALEPRFFSWVLLSTNSRPNVEKGLLQDKNPATANEPHVPQTTTVQIFKLSIRIF